MGRKGENQISTKTNLDINFEKKLCKNKPRAVAINSFTTVIELVTGHIGDI